MTAVVTMSQLLEAGVYYGHRTQRWNPKMEPYIHGKQNGIYIIDLRQTLKALGEVYVYVRDLVANNGTLMFVGTKPSIAQGVKQYAEQCGMPYVNERWLGGTLTNFATISLQTARLEEFQAMEDAGDFEQMPKKEALTNQREMARLKRNLGGIRFMKNTPDAIFVLDIQKEHIAATEAKKLGISTIAVVDTNCNPDMVDFVIPGNDDSILSGQLMCRVVAEAVIAGKAIAAQTSAAQEEEEAAETVGVEKEAGVEATKTTEAGAEKEEVLEKEAVTENEAAEKGVVEVTKTTEAGAEKKEVAEKEVAEAANTSTETEGTENEDSETEDSKNENTENESLNDNTETKETAEQDTQNTQNTSQDSIQDTDSNSDTPDQENLSEQS